eukprot:TRINITY_DN4440_c0_g1_i1.p1 TRINITY_DN4440_c0_g1~~TRINITY_DN4440_c0_g1_i1.p1  ORF type:complete len:717 (+),score=116.77 TRINITY_DN4440_c0_g1_i1:60-2210(+)
MIKCFFVVNPAGRVYDHRKVDERFNLNAPKTFCEYLVNFDDFEDFPSAIHINFPKCTILNIYRGGMFFGLVVTEYIPVIMEIFHRAIHMLGDWVSTVNAELFKSSKNREILDSILNDFVFTHINDLSNIKVNIGGDLKSFKEGILNAFDEKVDSLTRAQDSTMDGIVKRIEVVQKDLSNQTREQLDTFKELFETKTGSSDPTELNVPIKPVRLVMDNDLINGASDDISRRFRLNVRLLSVNNFKMHIDGFYARFMSEKLNMKAPVRTSPTIVVYPHSETKLGEAYFDTEFILSNNEMIDILSNPLEVQLFSKNNNIGDHILGVASVVLENVLKEPQYFCCGGHCSFCSQSRKKLNEHRSQTDHRADPFVARRVVSTTNAITSFGNDAIKSIGTISCEIKLLDYGTAESDSVELMPEVNEEVPEQTLKKLKYDLENERQKLENDKIRFDSWRMKEQARMREHLRIMQTEINRESDKRTLTIETELSEKAKNLEVQATKLKEKYSDREKRLSKEEQSVAEKNGALDSLLLQQQAKFNDDLVTQRVKFEAKLHMHQTEANAMQFELNARMSLMAQEMEKKIKELSETKTTLSQCQAQAEHHRNAMNESEIMKQNVKYEGELRFARLQASKAQEDANNWKERLINEKKFSTSLDKKLKAAEGQVKRMEENEKRTLKLQATINHQHQMEAPSNKKLNELLFRLSNVRANPTDEQGIDFNTI